MKKGIRREKQLRVPVYPDEERQIKEQAAAAGCSIAEYLRRVSLGYEIKSVIDQEHIIELAKINGDLGRIGGLLKLWLTDDPKLALFGEQQVHKAILGVLSGIKQTQQAMYEVVKILAAKKNDEAAS